MISEEKIVKNWEKHLKIVDTFISEPRKEKLLGLYKDLEDQIVIIPASSKPYLHNAFPGGYVDHVNRVVQCSLEVKNLWEKLGATVNFTEEELVFSALNHDLGKVGEVGLPNYVDQDNDWRRKNMQELYTQNTDLPFMQIQDRSLFLLQSAGIEVSKNEYLAIKLHDGLYDETNKPYYMSYQPTAALRTNIVYILHQADLLAAKIEYDTWKKTQK